MEEKKDKNNGAESPGGYDMWFVGGVPHRENDLSEKISLLLHKIFPVPWQHSFRDFGGSGHTFHGLAVVKGISLALADRKLVPRFLRLNRHLKTYPYGSHPSQVVEVIPRQGPREDMPLAPDYVTVFFHGGAWGSGTPKFYRLFGDTLTRTRGHTVVLIGYRIYPVGSVEDQIDDLGLGLKWVEDNREKVGLSHTTPVILAGHSSGAHISALYLIRRLLNPERFVGHAKINGVFSMSGVFDLWAQYRVEEFRGWHEISPLKGCTGPELHHMRHYNPIPLVYSQLTREIAERFPPILIMHGMKDEIVAFSQSSDFQIALLSKGVRSVTLEFTAADHFGIIKEIMLPTDGDTALDSFLNFCSCTSIVPRAKL